MFDQQQIPARRGHAADDDPLGEVTAAWQQLVGRRPDAVRGLGLPDDVHTLAQNFQRHGRQDVPRGAAKAIQADWTKFDAELKARERRTRRDEGPTGPGPCRPAAARRAAAGGPGAGRAAERGLALLAARAVFFVLFTFGPLLYAAWLSLYEWDGLTVGKYVGLDNYREVLGDPDVRSAFEHALDADHLLLLRAGAAGARAHRLLTRHPVRGFTFFRTVLFLPQTIAGVVIARLVWFYAEGPLNAALDKVGLDCWPAAGSATSLGAARSA